MKDKAFIDDIQNLKPGDGVDGYEYGADLQTEGSQMIDPALGQTITIRTFEFKMNPDLKEIPSKQELFNAHARQVSTILWADGLVPLEEVLPKLVINLKNKTYQIFVAAKPNRSNTFVETPKKISEYLNASTRH